MKMIQNVIAPHNDNAQTDDNSSGSDCSGSDSEENNSSQSDTDSSTSDREENDCEESNSSHNVIDHKFAIQDSNEMEILSNSHYPSKKAKHFIFCPVFFYTTCLQVNAKTF